MACHGAGQPEASVQNDVPTEWKFNFFTPQALPTVVTFVAILDAGGTDYRFNTLDSTKALYGVVGEWNDSQILGIVTLVRNVNALCRKVACENQIPQAAFLHNVIIRTNIYFFV